MTQKHRLLIFDLVMISVLSAPVFFIVVFTQHAQEILPVVDAGWYLNRAMLYWRGIFRDEFVYTLTYPLLVGGVNRLVHELALAGLIVNWLILLSLAVGTYLLGRSFYSRAVGWLAAITIVTSTSIYVAGRYLGADILFIAIVVWCLVAYVRVTRYPTAGGALVFGGMLVVAIFTRFEGLFYAPLLIPLAALNIAHSRKSWRLALQLASISTALFALGVLAYLGVLFKNADSSGSVYALLIMRTEAPFPWDIMSRRVADVLSTSLVHWPGWAWWIVLVGVLWGRPTYRKSNYTFAALIGLNVSYVFIITGWPYPRYTAHFLPYFALLFAATVFSLGEKWGYKYLFVPALIVAIAVPGLTDVVRFAQTPPLAYRDSDLFQEAQALDTWLSAHHWQDREVYTLCFDPLPFSRSFFTLIYRLALSLDPSKYWNTPAQLLPTIHDNNRLFMSCDNQNLYPDWKAYFAHPDTAAIPYRFSEVGRVGRFVFYGVVPAQ